MTPPTDMSGMRAAVASAWVVSRADWQAFVDDLCRRRLVYAPLAEGDGVAYRPLPGGDALRCHSLPTPLSAKGLLLPQRETLLRYRLQGGQAHLETPGPGPAAVILGVPPCDARAFQLLDRVFDTPEQPDVYYVARRRQTLIVGWACLAPRATCFCSQVGGDPFGRDGCDLLLTDLAAEYLVEAGSPAGQELLAGVPWPAPGREQRARAERLAAQARRSLPAPEPPPHLAALSAALLEAPLWGDLAQRCLGCGVCSYVCPACHCFDIVDEPGCPGCGERVRNWDSCQFAVYSLEASGHNPRPGRRERLRQRVLDKFAYLPLRSGLMGCVGCGRCVRSCPANVDLREIIAEVRHA